MKLAFVESSVFTKRVTTLGLEEGLRRLQQELLANPLAGDTDPGTGGLRKIRLADPSQRRGKRGGYRVHYLYLAPHRIIALAFIYSKSESDGLSASQKRTLKTMAETIIETWQSV